MALKKAIRQMDGVTTNYHRILFIMATTNSHNSIAVLSYVDEQAREDELNHIIELPYQKSTTYETEYKENMTIEEAYEYLKTTPEFEGAEDATSEHEIIEEVIPVPEEEEIVEPEITENSENVEEEIIEDEIEETEEVI